mmetsp:Transcript_22814/g.63738  ORF Transcript_22814/g.63738 Transcript_22814/m.63738 type:complete len:100 (-) Transcript_22814:62-361(-)
MVSKLTKETGFATAGRSKNYGDFKVIWQGLDIESGNRTTLLSQLRSDSCRTRSFARLPFAGDCMNIARLTFSSTSNAKHSEKCRTQPVREKRTVVARGD